MKKTKTTQENLPGGQLSSLSQDELVKRIGALIEKKQQREDAITDEVIEKVIEKHRHAQRIEAEEKNSQRLKDANLGYLSPDWYKDSTTMKGFGNRPWSEVMAERVANKKI